MPARCTHIRHMQPVVPLSEGCQECLATGSDWVHLRLCLVCGHVGCCDSSPNQHATRHFHETGHPLIKPFDSDEDWIWCYVDQVAVIAPDE